MSIVLTNDGSESSDNEVKYQQENLNRTTEGTSSQLSALRSTLGQSEELSQVPMIEKPSVLSMVFSKPFLLIYLMNTLSLVTGIFTVNNFKTYGQKNGLTNENYLAWLGSFAAALSAIRFIWSTSTDYLSYKTVYAVLLSMQVVLCLTVPLISHNAGLYAIWVCLIAFCEGGHFSMVPNVIKKIFGDQSTGLYGILYSYSGIVAIMLIVF